MTRPGDVRVFGAGEITASRDAVLWVARLAQEARASLRNGGRVDPDVERWTDALVEAAERTLTSARCSEIGTSELPTGSIEPVVRMLDPVDTTEASRLLTRTTREVVRLVHTRAFPSARMVGGRYLIERSEVLARAQRGLPDVAREPDPRGVRNPARD